MKAAHLSRRLFLQDSIGLALPVMIGTEAATGANAANSQTASGRPLRVLCVGAHPDDPESGCGGTLLRYVEAGHSVTILYLTRGERGIRNKSLEESARIRSAESEAACKIIGAKPAFFGQIDGATEVTRSQVDAMTKLLSDHNPDVVFTHWPVDTHMDHQVASFLTIRACMALGDKTHLYFFEVDTGDQSRGFLPDTYVDISAVIEKKKSALFAHVSQNGQRIWQEHHQVMANWRGREAGVAGAEAFVHLSRDSQFSSLPGV
jgi:LmbE family N-acetylglucosaminyl deacetylase